jgi:hypothetical protein
MTHTHGWQLLLTGQGGQQGLLTVATLYGLGSCSMEAGFQEGVSQTQGLLMAHVKPRSFVMN